MLIQSNCITERRLNSEETMLLIKRVEMCVYIYTYIYTHTHTHIKHKLARCLLNWKEGLDGEWRPQWEELMCLMFSFNLDGYFWFCYWENNVLICMVYMLPCLNNKILILIIVI